MGNTVVLIVGALLVTFGVICIYDARVISNKMFGFGDQNEASLGLKMIGFILSVIGSLIILLNMGG